MSNWPFADPPNAMTITVRQIMHDGDPILYVVHDADDGSWQFLTGGKFVRGDSLLVGLERMVQLDATLLELADLPLGWQAERSAKDQPWRRSESPYEDT